MQITKTEVIIPVAKWNELKSNDYFRELIEVLEDSLDLEQAKEETKTFTDYREYSKKRNSKLKNA
ncbi:MAG: hypothetical protein J0M18_10565 [Ignavibacteria bacterium]|jgi:hypothetical protein|nr:hypothetical protein [Ignavibacteria bacterium]